MAHSPNIISYVLENNIVFDHLVKGHTHGGQINILKSILRRTCMIKAFFLPVPKSIEIE
jgi:predicted MPP superfamily phosphohydrolase